VLHLTSPAIDPHTQSDEQLIATARAAMGIGEHPLEVHKLTRWPVDALIASAFGAGRVYLVGDAAHRHPPTGGLGLNSAVHDSFNLCWKLASVLRGDAGPELLESYEAERRPCDELNAQRSLENAVNHYVIAAAAGVTFEQTEEQNLANLARLFSGAQEDAEHRSAVLRGMRAQSMEFDEHNVEIGHLYSSTAVLPDTSDAPASPDAVRVHAPDARPGSPLPHAWIEDEDGNRTALRELVRPGRFLLIAGEDGEAWCDAARALAATGAPVDAVRIGHLDGDLFDPRSTWARTRGFGPQGAALVRPDRVVAWRRSDAGEHPREALGAALGAILSTPHTHVTTNA
jgi:2,4-dichlorophenol 6-monooxygenase